MEMTEQKHSNSPLEYQSETGRLNILGFWIFLGAEIALFATLFGTYFALTGRTANGPLPGELFELKGVLIETFLLLTSSFTCGIAVHEMRKGNKIGLLIWMGLTVLMGIGFLTFEISEFVQYVHEGASLSSSAFWSGFFVLVGTHGAHVTMGVFWISFVLIQVMRRGLTPTTSSKIFITSLYWHFLDVVWIFIFTGVYMIGMVMHNG